MSKNINKMPRKFQSTLPVRGATDVVKPCHKARHISIHAPRAGSDMLDDAEDMGIIVFQSTLPVRGATAAELKKLIDQYISIHAPRAGSDLRRLHPTK